MVSVRMLLAGGHVTRFDCADDDPVLEKIGFALSRLGASAAGAPPGLLQLEIVEDGQARSLEIPNSAIVAVETDPPLALGKGTWLEQVERAPYIRIPDFLSADEHRAVLDFAVAHEADYTASTVTTGEVGYRHSRVLHALDDMPVDLEARVREIMPDLLDNLGLDPLPDATVERQLTVHNEGDYFKAHNDNGSPGTANRVLTYIYYFHGEPRRFGGGGLRLFDSRIAGDVRSAADSFIHLRPANNMMVFFPSRLFHEVLPVDCLSGDFADSRFTINGWVRDATQTVPDAP